MTPTRVLVVDDALPARRLLVDALSSDPDLRVVGTAASARIALAKIDSLQPGVVVLDLAMMHGLETVEEVRRRHAGLPIIVFGSESEPGVAQTLEALWLGAKDHVAELPADCSRTAAVHVRAELIPRIKALCAPRRGQSRLTAPARRRPQSVRRADVRGVVIGGGSGGVSALTAVLRMLTPGIPVPILVLQQMPPHFSRPFAAGLALRVGFPVSEASQGCELNAGCAWIAPGGSRMTVKRARQKPIARIEREGSDEVVDALLDSAADLWGAGTLAVVLSGMGEDGLAGCRHVHAVGGRVLVQDEVSSAVWQMPGVVARAGFAQSILTPEQIGQEILKRVLDAHAPRRGAA